MIVYTFRQLECCTKEVWHIQNKWGNSKNKTKNIWNCTPLKILQWSPKAKRAECSLAHLQFSHSVVSDSLHTHGQQHAKPPCPSLTPRVYPNACPLSHWCHPTISSSVVPFSSHLQAFPASGSFPMSQFFTSGGQRIGVSASALVLPMSIQDWFPLGWTAWISLKSKGLSRVFSNTTVQKHQLFCTQLCL